MDKHLFAELVESVTEMGEIIRGERKPSREFTRVADEVKGIRKAFGLSQAKFARLIDVEIATLRNWEQGRRAPTGPARVLLRALGKNPKALLKAIA